MKRGISVTEFEEHLGPRWTGWRGRYWAKVDQQDDDQCWLWKGNNPSQRYPMFRIGSKNLHKYFLTHRIAYELAYSPIPDGLNVLHSCDQPRCCNPAHLRAGTQADNVNDAVTRDRTAHGMRNANRKLTADEVRDVKRRLRSGEMQKDIAADLGVSRPTISSIASGRTWRRVA